jgi:hypothetical protein
VNEKAKTISKVQKQALARTVIVKVELAVLVVHSTPSAKEAKSDV